MPPTSTAEPVPAVLLEGVRHVYPAGRRRKTQPTDHDKPQRAALDDISFAIEPGEMFGILGPNGGGKTTLFRIITTMLRQTAGNVRVCGHDVATEPARVRTVLGVVFQNPGLDTQLTAAENLHHQGKLYGLAGDDLDGRIEHWLKRFGLADRRHDLIEDFSGGMRRRIELAKAMLHQPQVLLLDEPATGLDPGGRRELWQYLDDLRDRGVTVVMTTHLMEAADRCDRIAILSEGRLVALAAPGDLKAKIGGDVISVQPVDDAEDLCGHIAERFAPWPEGGDPTVVDGQVHFERGEGPAFLAALHEAFPGRIQSITIGQPTLEDVFLHLTGHTLWDDANGD